MSKKIFIVYGHHNIKKSFNASVRDIFIEEAKKSGELLNKLNIKIHSSTSNKLHSHSTINTDGFACNISTHI